MKKEGTGFRVGEVWLLICSQRGTCGASLGGPGSPSCSSPRLHTQGIESKKVIGVSKMVSSHPDPSW
jgi:hypothetical protein